MTDERTAQKVLADTFRRGSKTYFNSSLFFPKAVRRNVFKLYGFVRTADNFVDCVPQDPRGFYDFCDRYRSSLSSGRPSGNVIVDSFLEVAREKSFDPAWTDAFLKSMEMDLTKKTYATLDEMLEYVYGSAEVIGLFMARIMDLPEEAFGPAKMLGRAMQTINFIRDIAEDLRLGRTYLPLSGSGLDSLEEKETRGHPEIFRQFVLKHIGLYRGWQAEAARGFAFIPRRMRIPVRTASDMYFWTSEQIRRDPFVVYRRQVKPPRPLILLALFRNALTP